MCESGFHCLAKKKKAVLLFVVLLESSFFAAVSRDRQNTNAFSGIVAAVVLPVALAEVINMSGPEEAVSIVGCAKFVASGCIVPIIEGVFRR